MDLNRFNLLVVFMIAILVFFQYRLWFEQGGMKNLLQLKKSLAVQAADNQRLKQYNDELREQIQRLQKSKDATESRARNELGMIKRNEKFYQIVN